MSEKLPCPHTHVTLGVQIRCLDCHAQLELDSKTGKWVVVAPFVPADLLPRKKDD